jgi:hemolysin III
MYKGERFNSISHLVGASLALAGGAVLVTYAAIDGDPYKIVSYSVYGVTLFLLYLISTLYHSLPGPAKRIFRVLDHQAIYLLIAGTYTPFTMVALTVSKTWWVSNASSTIWTKVPGNSYRHYDWQSEHHSQTRSTCSRCAFRVSWHR